MIIYDMRKLIKITDGEGVGVVGENLSQKEEFFIKGLTDSSMRFSLFLRFADGSVNAVFPDSAEIKDGGVSIIWNVRKNDLFMHGYFELQIEGRKDDELIFQTEIIRLYADESIPIEDDKYPNPNSESLKLRDEIYRLLEEIDKKLKIIEEMNIPDKENVLSVSATFDENGVPLSIANKTILSAGDFSANAQKSVTAFISSSVTAIQGGSLSNCTNLTDVYINNTSDQVTISNGAIPSTAKIHYKDTYNSLPQIEYALKRLSSSIDASTLTGKIPVSNLPDEALTRIQVVNDDETRLKLTTSLIQDGDFIKVESTGKIYIVKDSGRLGTEDAFVEFGISEHTHSAGDITSVNASAIKGKISVSNLPDEALTRIQVVNDDETRLKLTTSLIQDGDFVKVESTGKIYIVKDSGRLGTEGAFVEFGIGEHTHSAGDITSVNASAIKGKIPVSNLPDEALTRIQVVNDDETRLKLTTSLIQDGDFVKVESTGKIYIVKDSGRLGTEGAFVEFGIGEHTHSAGDITSVNASAIKGKIPVSNLPDEALTRIQVVNDDETRLKLTTSLIQDGDFVKVESTGKIYIVKDSGRLGTEGAFTEITAVNATYEEANELLSF